MDRLRRHQRGRGAPEDEVEIVQGDTDQTPFGLGTYGSRSTPVSGAAAVTVARKVRERARQVASAMLEVDPGDLEWERGRWFVREVPDHRGLADGIGMALMELVAFDLEGNHLGGSFMDYLLPTALECPSWELGETVTPSPHHPIGAKGVGESATVGSPAAVVNAVVDALAPYGVRHADMPLTPAAVWRAMRGDPLRSDLAV